TDGRIVHFDPKSKILVAGKEVTLGEVRPGSMVALVPGASTTAATAPSVVASPPTVTMSPPPATITQGASVPASSAVRSPAAVDVSGRVASVDPATSIVTFQDGRMVRVS